MNLNWRKSLCALAVTAGLLASSNAWAKGNAKEYQVTGPVLSVEDNVVTVQKDDEKWEIEITSDTKVEGKLKPGEKVTIYYHMVASKVDKKGSAEKSSKDTSKKK